ncbi:hypothetical protein [Sulfitobacter sp. PS-8MA]|uniref:hypothetical protein n=1 Tax=Sulfitobacter sp. PS-8MA TaxID=3237707 RepID=UPI0034C5F339
MQVNEDDFEELARAAFRSVTIGPGTCDRAKFLILLGYAQEQNILAKRRLAEVRPGVGRPRKGKFGDIDCFRAFMIWKVAKTLKPVHPYSNREWVGMMQQLADQGAVERHVFPRNEGLTLEQSVSRGKSKLSISQNWLDSEVCEKLQEYFSQTT